MSASEYLKAINAEWHELATKNANGLLLRKEQRLRFTELAKARQRLGKKWQK